MTAAHMRAIADAAAAETLDRIEFRERVGERVMLAMVCTHDGDEFGTGAVCRTCFGNTQRIGAIVENEVERALAAACLLADP